MPRSPTPAVYMATKSFVCTIEGRNLSFRKGDPVEAGHPAITRYPAFFGPLVFRHPIRVEPEKRDF